MRMAGFCSTRWPLLPNGTAEIGAIERYTHTADNPIAGVDSRRDFNKELQLARSQAQAQSL
jgi:hypothetical protein